MNIFPIRVSSSPLRLTLAGILLLSLSACAGEGEEDLGRVSVAISADDYTGGQLAFNVALANGYFEEEGIEIEDYLTDTAPNTLQALINEQVDVGFLSLSTVAQAVEQGRNVKLAAAVQTTNDWSVLVSTAWLEEEGIDPDELLALPPEERGEIFEEEDTVWATNSAGGLWERASAYLAEWYDLDPERDVHLAPIDDVNKISGLRDGSVQVWLASAPNNSFMVEEAAAVELLTTEELAEHLPLLAHARSAETIINDDWAAENPEVAEGFFRAYQRGAEYVIENDVDTILEVTEERYGDFDEERIRRTIEVNQENLPRDSRHPEEAIEAQIEFAVFSGNISEPLPVEDVYTEEYLPPADDAEAGE